MQRKTDQGKDEERFMETKNKIILLKKEVPNTRVEGDLSHRRADPKLQDQAQKREKLQKLARKTKDLQTTNQERALEVQHSNTKQEIANL